MTMRRRTAVRRWCGRAAVLLLAAFAAGGGLLLVRALAKPSMTFFSGGHGSNGSSSAREAEARRHKPLELTAIDSASALVRSTVAARVIPGAAVAIGTDTGVLDMRG